RLDQERRTAVSRSTILGLLPVLNGETMEEFSRRIPRSRAISSPPGHARSGPNSGNNRLVQALGRHLGGPALYAGAYDSQDSDSRPLWDHPAVVREGIPVLWKLVDFPRNRFARGVLFSPSHKRSGTGASASRLHNSPDPY